MICITKAFCFETSTGRAMSVSMIIDTVEVYENALYILRQIFGDEYKGLEEKLIVLSSCFWNNHPRFQLPTIVNFTIIQPYSVNLLKEN